MARPSALSSVAAVLLLAASHGMSQDSPDNDAHFEATTACVEAVKVNVGEILVGAPEFADLRSAVEWMSHGLQGEVLHVFDRATQTMRNEQLTSFPQDGKGRKQYLQRARYVLWGEFFDIAYCSDGASVVAPSQFSQSIYLAVIQASPVLVEDFGRLGYFGSFEIKQVLPLIVLMEKVGAQWDSPITTQSSSRL